MIDGAIQIIMSIPSMITIHISKRTVRRQDRIL
ncbi:hypothetical protein Y590_05625 [Methylobacterium sp. AMS5]|nr:hypothetical protein Y590_05625 [Methylobacterium sp. AMS5]